MKQITIFWNWFQDNHHNIKNLIHETSESQKNILFWIHKNLGYYSRELDFIIVFPKNQKDKTEFIITAKGNPDYFHQIIDLIDKAPALRTWKFTAFIKTYEAIELALSRLDNPYIIPDIRLKKTYSIFTPLNPNKTSQKQNIMIYLNNDQVLCNNESLNQAIFIILQDLMGKNILYQKINLVQLASLPDTEEENMIHLIDLQAYIDNFNTTTKTHNFLFVIPTMEGSQLIRRHFK
jgi:hypothetical protein